MITDADVVVIGAGIVGLSTARSLVDAVPRGRLLVVDKEAEVAAHQSGHNSGVLHSGIYYRHDSSKARLCSQGRAAMADYCDRHGIELDQCGKVIVAASAADLAPLAELERRAQANGLHIERLDRAGIKAHEPHATGLAGLFVAATGVVDFRAVCHSLADGLRARGVSLGMGVSVHDIDNAGKAAPASVGRSPVRIHTSEGPVTTRAVVNCAGLQADVIARRCGARPEVRIMPFRGEYARLVDERRFLVRHLLYPVPDPRFPFLGVHLNRGIDGTVHAGPNAVLALAREGYRWSAVSPAELAGMATRCGAWRLAGRYWRTGVTEVARSLCRTRFVAALQQLVPEITDEDLQPARAGVRAQAVARDGTLPDDFVLTRQGSCVHVLNAPSPAATASLAIGAVIAGWVREALEGESDLPTR